MSNVVMCSRWDFSIFSVFSHTPYYLFLSFFFLFVFIFIWICFILSCIRFLYWKFPIIGFPFFRYMFIYFPISRPSFSLSLPVFSFPVHIFHFPLQSVIVMFCSKDFGLGLNNITEETILGDDGVCEEVLGHRRPWISSDVELKILIKKLWEYIIMYLEMRLEARK